MNTETYVQGVAEKAWDSVIAEIIGANGAVIDSDLARLLVSTLEAGASQVLRDLMLRLNVIDVPAFMEKIGWTP